MRSDENNVICLSVSEISPLILTEYCHISYVFSWFYRKIVIYMIFLISVYPFN